MTDTDDLARAVARWLYLRATHERYPPTSYGQLGADADHSSLLRRLLSGKEPLPQPPPLSFSYPWYQLIETGQEERCCAYFQEDNTVTINQHSWRVVTRDETTWIIAHDGAPGTWLLWYADPMLRDFGWSLRRIDDEHSTTPLP